MSGTPKRATVLTRPARRKRREPDHARKVQEAARRREEEAARVLARLREEQRQDEEGRQLRAAQVAARAALDELEARLAGLSQDPLVSRWRRGALGAALEEARELRGQLARAEGPDREALAPQAGPGPEAVARVEARARALMAEEPAWIEAAGQAQLQADHRDDLAEAISQALGELGYSVSLPRPEHPGHPASALLLEAHTAAGRSLGVSVPIEGEVFYHVEGFSEHDPEGVEGGCGEAGAALRGLHELLERSYEVEAGEITWEGKGPDRALRRADSLPGGREAGGSLRRR